MQIFLWDNNFNTFVSIARNEIFRSYANFICNFLRKFHTVSLLDMLVTQSCPTLYDSMDCRLPVFSVHGILQARILEWIALPFSRESSQLRYWTRVSCIAGRFFTIWATREAPKLDMPVYIPTYSTWGFHFF